MCALATVEAEKKLRREKRYKNGRLRAQLDFLVLSVSRMLAYVLFLQTVHLSRCRNYPLEFSSVIEHS